MSSSSWWYDEAAEDFDEELTEEEKEELDEAILEGDGWISRAQALVTAASATALGISIWEDPFGFVIAAIVEWVTEGILSIAGEIALLIEEMWTLLAIDVFATAGRALLSPFSSISEIILEDIVLEIAEIINAAALEAGPLAPFVVVLLWGGMIFLLLIVLERVVRVLFGIALGVVR